MNKKWKKSVGPEEEEEEQPAEEPAVCVSLILKEGRRIVYFIMKITIIC